MAADSGAKVTTVSPSRSLRTLSHPAVHVALPLVVFAIALYVLHKLAANVSWSDVKADLAAASFRSLALAVIATAVSFVGISFYDIVAVRIVAEGKVPPLVAALAGAAGTAVSNLLGFSYVTGTTIRYRVYSSLGLDIAAIAGILATTWIAISFGLALILGMLLAFHPVGLHTVIPLGKVQETTIGIVLLVSLAMIFGWLSRGRKQLAFRSFVLPLPTAGPAVILTCAAVTDLMGSAVTLYMFMPDDLVRSFPYFFVIYIAATGLGVLSHSPGGLGVFEATIVAGFGAGGRSDVLAALLLYRLVFSILPFAMATIGLAIAWGLGRRASVSGAASWSYRLVRPIVPPLAAGISLIAGSILLVSGSLPPDSARLGVLSDILPLSFIEASHLAGSIVGLLLIVISRGLYRRLHRAWIAAMVLMLTGSIASLAKGLDWEEALSLLITLLLLGLFRSAFYRVDGGLVFRLNGAWIFTTLVLVAAAIWIGFFAYSHVGYNNTLWWEFALHGDASRFMRASMAVAVVLGVLAFNSLIVKSPAAIRTTHAIPDVVRHLVAQSEDTEANLALMGDKAFLVSEDGRAFLCYADTGASLIAKGDPVGEPDAGRELIWRLREQADRMGRRCGFYAVSNAYLPVYLDMGLSILKIGEVARVDLAGFTLDGSSKRDFRQARSRAIRDGYEFAIIPADELAPILPDLRRISDAWLASKHGEEKGFALGSFDEQYIANFDHAILRHKDTGDIVAFANLFQGANKHELSLDLMRYKPDGPKFAMDALFAGLMLWGSQQGFHWFSLGAAPLSGIEKRKLASLWNRIAGFVYQHGGHFYRFEGLREYKQKFAPVWTPNYLASPGGLAVPRILYEINVLISGGLKGLIR